MSEIVERLAREIEATAEAWRGVNGGIFTVRAMSLELARKFSGRMAGNADEVESLKAECRAKGEAIAAMQRRLDWMEAGKHAAMLSHEGQRRNTEVFLRERNEALEALKGLLPENNGGGRLTFETCERLRALIAKIDGSDPVAQGSE